MPPNKRPEDEAPLSEKDKLAEQVIAALKYLSDECRKTGLTDYGALVEEAFDQCLKLYVEDQRKALTDKLSDDEPEGGSTLN